MKEVESEVVLYQEVVKQIQEDSTEENVDEMNSKLNELLDQEVELTDIHLTVDELDKYNVDLSSNDVSNLHWLIQE